MLSNSWQIFILINKNTKWVIIHILSVFRGGIQEKHNMALLDSEVKSMEKVVT